MNWLTPFLRLSTAFPHPVITILGAIVVAAMAGLLGQGAWRARLNYAGYLAVCCVASVVAGSWAMHFIHG
jgi:hypothetical protein